MNVLNYGWNKQGLISVWLASVVTCFSHSIKSAFKLKQGVINKLIKNKLHIFAVSHYQCVFFVLDWIFKHLDISHTEYLEKICCMCKQAWSPHGPGTSTSQAPVNLWLPSDDVLTFWITYQWYSGKKQLRLSDTLKGSSGPVSVCCRQSLTSCIQLQDAASIAVSFYSDFICYILTSFVDKSYSLV